MTTELALGDLIQTRKKHPCGSDRWVIIRVGADIKIKCKGCGRIVMLERAGNVGIQRFEPFVNKLCFFLLIHQTKNSLPPKAG